MKFFFPDSQDHVDPTFDFATDLPDADRGVQVTDQYAHEALGAPPYDGMLLSKSIVDGIAGRAGKFTTPQRHRLRRNGVHAFFRLEKLRAADGGPFPVMADCGAFSYVREEVPPITVEQAIEFYETCGFTHGQSVDHIIGDFRPDWDEHGLFGAGAPEAVRGRYDITLRLAGEFMKACRDKHVSFTPVGVAQGWSPGSYVAAVERLQNLGYRYIAIGGLVPLKTNQFMAVVRAVMAMVRGDVKIHLLGVIRWNHLDELIQLGVASFDSTSPLRQAFLDSSANYYAGDLAGHAYAAVRVPQLDGNLRLKQGISSGVLDLENARRLERECLTHLREHARNVSTTNLADLLDLLDAYVGMIDSKVTWRSKHERTLSARPWEQCLCPICKRLGVEVIMFRGANRNRRRGFHNLYVAYERLRRALQRAQQHLEAS